MSYGHKHKYGQISGGGDYDYDGSVGGNNYGDSNELPSTSIVQQKSEDY